MTNTSRFTKKSMSGLKSSLISLEGQLHNNRLSKFLMQHLAVCLSRSQNFETFASLSVLSIIPQATEAFPNFCFIKRLKTIPFLTDGMLAHRWSSPHRNSSSFLDIFKMSDTH